MKATTRRSYQMVKRVSTSSTTKANSALRSTTHHGSLKNTARSIATSRLIGLSPPCHVLGDGEFGRRPNRDQIAGAGGQVLGNPKPGAAREPDDTVHHLEPSTAGNVMEPRSLLIIATLVIPASRPLGAYPGLGRPCRRLKVRLTVERAALIERHPPSGEQHGAAGWLIRFAGRIVGGL